ncbi:MAG TPA: hypothetical protein DCX07_05950 [Phycisphaerales bacterium]|nr:hypothetical protein [Phycisphaerales bacterium]
MSCRNAHRRNKPGLVRGFTLAELLVLLLVLAITAVVVIPAAIDTTDSQAVSAARLLASDLQYAQNVAITTQRPVYVTFNVGAEQYQLSTPSELNPNERVVLNHPITKAPYVIDFSTQRGFGRTNVVSASFGGLAEVGFDELGAPSSAGTVTLQAGSRVYRISVTAATGKVTVAEGSS